MLAVPALICLVAGGLGVQAPRAGGAIFVDVPFVSQADEGCGAASISMVLQYWDAQSHVSPPAGHFQPEIMRALYSREEKGILARDMIRYFESQNFRAYAFQGTWDLVVQHLEKGRPLIVALKPAVLHYVVVSGIDRDGSFVLVNDPAQRKLAKLTRAEFEKAWNGSHNWTLLALP